MSSSPTSTKLKTIAFAAVSTAAFAAAVTVVLPELNKYRHDLATSLRMGAKSGSSPAIIADYYASTLLEPHNTPAILDLAQMQFAAGDLNSAGETLRRVSPVVRTNRLAQVQFGLQRYVEAGRTASEGLQADPNQFELELLLGKAELEQGHLVSARQAFTNAVKLRPDDSVAQTLIGLTAVVAGEGTTNLNAFVSSPDAARRVLRAATDQVALAQELYVAGLLETPSAILAKLPPISTDVLILRAHIALDRAKPSEAALTAARSDVQTAIKLNPADPAIWRLLAVLDDRLGDPRTASFDRTQLERLNRALP